MIRGQAELTGVAGALTRQGTRRRLAIAARRAHLLRCPMKTAPRRPAKRIELGKHIVADPEICHGQPTFKGTRVMVWIVLDQVARGMDWDEIVKEWRGRVPRAAVAEAVRLASEAFKGEGTRQFRVHSRRKLSREPSLAVA